MQTVFTQLCEAERLREIFFICFINLTISGFKLDTSWHGLHVRSCYWPPVTLICAGPGRYKEIKLAGMQPCVF